MSKPGFIEPHTPIVGTTKQAVQFWRWAYSDVAQNVTRGAFAEFLVVTALGIEAQYPRDPWGGSDLVLDHRGKQFRIEVKSTAPIQAWEPRDRTKQRKTTGFSLGFAKIEYTLDGGRFPAKGSHVYVLALDNVPDTASLRKLDATRWQFWVLSRSELEGIIGASVEAMKGRTKSISFHRLEKSEIQPVGFDALGALIRDKCSQS
jgi:hypothetical protein